MIEHDRYRDMVAARHDLQPDETASLDTHLQICDDCRQLSAEFARQDTFLQALRLPEPAPDLRHGVFHRIADSATRGRRWSILPARWQWLAYVAPAAAVVVLLSAVLLHSQPSHPTAQTDLRASPALRDQPHGSLPRQAGPNHGKTRGPIFGPGRPSSSTQLPSNLPIPTPQIVNSAADSSALGIVGAVVFLGRWTGSARSRWLRLPAGRYAVETRNRPVGCLHSAALVGVNGYHVVELEPNFAPHVRNFKGGKRWAGYSAQLVAGRYRLEGTAASGCRWTARITR